MVFVVFFEVWKIGINYFEILLDFGFRGIVCIGVGYEVFFDGEVFKVVMVFYYLNDVVFD